MKKLLVIGVLLLSQPLVAQIAEPTMLYGAESYDIPSKKINSSIRISVSLPQGYDKSSDKKYPVMYVLDAFYSFPILHELHKVMAGEIEPVIIVGIGDDRISMLDWMVTRYPLLTHDYDAYEDSFQVNVLLKGAPVKLISGSGQQYYDAIKNEVIPFVETKYNTNSDRGLVGHSLGGLFTSHILFKDNGYFTRFGINSAALFFNNDESFKLEKNYFETKKQLDGKVFISAGGLEGNKMFVNRANKFADNLRSRKYKSLKIESFIFKGESHTSVIGAMLSKSLFSLYGLDIDRKIGNGHK